MDAMAPHYALLEEALADGGHLDVIFSDMAGWLKNAAEYLQQINAALGRGGYPLVPCGRHRRTRRRHGNRDNGCNRGPGPREQAWEPLPCVPPIMPMRTPMDRP